MYIHMKLLGVTTAAAALFVCGCGGSGPKLGRVSGKVTLDGQPLEGAAVEFHSQEGRGSIGVTDAQGSYQLSYTDDRMGAIIGQHTVRITMAAEELDADEDGRLPKSKIPPRYNHKSELSAEVKAGSNQLDFNLESQ